MKNFSATLVSACAIGLALCVTSVHGATTIVQDGTTAPAITSPSVGAFFGYNGVDYDGGNGFTDSDGPGQTFLTPIGTTGYNLNSITLQESAGSGFDPSTQNFVLGVFSVSGTTLTSLGEETYSFNSMTAPGDGGYFTLDTSALGLVLSAHTEYAFTFSDGSGVSYPNFLGLVSSGYGDTGTGGQDTYVDGEAIRGATALAADGTESFTVPTVGGNSYDRAFSVDLSVVPEPSTWAMMFGGIAVLLGVARLRRLSL